jgi:organic hydroperoxide reductase OsmC/OhrA
MADGKENTGRTHRYQATVTWTGNVGPGTANYRGYERSHEIEAVDKVKILGSSDPAFRGDSTRWNPEHLLVASLSSCHMLWYLHLCAAAGIVVVGYVDHAEGMMAEDAAGSGHFTRVILRPAVTITAGSDLEKAKGLHHEAHAKCFIANSVNFAVNHEAAIVSA